MPRKRRRYPAELKAKIALEALREESTMSELATGWPADQQIKCSRSSARRILRNSERDVSSSTTVTRVGTA